MKANDRLHSTPYHTSSELTEQVREGTQEGKDRGRNNEMEPHSQDAQARRRTTLETDSVTETKAGKETVGVDGHAQRPALYLLATCSVITPLP